MNRLVDMVVRRIGIDVGDRFSANARKVKFLISGLPADSTFPVKFTDFQVSPGLLLLLLLLLLVLLTPHHPPPPRPPRPPSTPPPGCAPLPPLEPEGVPDPPEEEGEERPRHLHLHCEEAGAPGPNSRGQAAGFPEGLRQPAGSQG